MVGAIEWTRRTGSPWEKLPEQFGSWKGLCTGLRNQAVDCTWAKASVHVSGAWYVENQEGLRLLV